MYCLVKNAKYFAFTQTQDEAIRLREKDERLKAARCEVVLAILPPGIRLNEVYDNK